MKLYQINENLLGRTLHGAGYLNRPFLHTQSLYNSNNGLDSGSRANGYTSLATGVPIDPRHRHFLGFEKRLGVIRL